MCLSNCKKISPVSNRYRLKCSNNASTRKAPPGLKNNLKTMDSSFSEEKHIQPKTIFYKILFQTTQPAHLLIAVTALILAYFLYSKNLAESRQILIFLYLGSFSTYLGTQVWMTFVSGLSLYFSLPRHHFGNVQKVLFPKYFLINALLNITTFTFYMKIHQDKSNVLQLSCLAISFVINLIIRLNFAPALLKYMELKNRMEEKVGVGMEIGRHDSGPLKNCVLYNQLYTNFRRYHMLIAIGNIITMGCTVFHLFYLSNKIDFIN